MSVKMQYHQPASAWNGCFNSYLQFPLETEFQEHDNARSVPNILNWIDDTEDSTRHGFEGYVFDESEIQSDSSLEELDRGLEQFEENTVLSICSEVTSRGDKSPPPYSACISVCSNDAYPSSPISSTTILPIVETSSRSVPDLFAIPHHISPINMDDVERIKSKRRREKNRVAAKRCRSKKVELISVLESQISELVKENGSLLEMVSLLKTKLSAIEDRFKEHAQNGCSIRSQQTLH